MTILLASSLVTIIGVEIYQLFNTEPVKIIEFDKIEIEIAFWFI